MRVTTNSMVRNYNTSLSSTLGALNTSRERLETRRKYTHASEDPSAALRESRLTKKYLEAEDNISKVEDAISRQDSADAVIQQISTMVSNAANDEGLKAINLTSAEDIKKTYSTSLRQMQQSILQLVNTKYVDSYLFSGADGKNPPFAIDDDGKVTFRGIDVSSTDPADQAKLAEMAGEKLYMDVGLGLQINGNGGVAGSYKDINGATAYDMAFSGLDMLGYGNVDGSTVSKNAIVLMGQMADALEAPTLNVEYFNELSKQLNQCHSDMADYNAKVGVKQQFLDTTKERLTTDQLNIYTQLDTTAYIKPTDAILDYSYSQYAYNMVLKVGSSLLTNSFIDFMK